MIGSHQSRLTSVNVQLFLGFMVYFDILTKKVIKVYS